MDAENNKVLYKNKSYFVDRKLTDPELINTTYKETLVDRNERRRRAMTDHVFGFPTNNEFEFE